MYTLQRASARRDRTAQVRAPKGDDASTTVPCEHVNESARCACTGIMDPEPDQKQVAELQNFMETEQQKAVIQAAIAKLTETCFDKCVTKPSSKLDSSEANCVANCAGRFLDSSVFVVNRMMAKRKGE